MARCPPVPSSARGRAEDAYGLLFDQVDNTVCTLDLEGRFTSVNRAGQTLTGYSEAELIGTPSVNLIAPELRDKAMQQFATRLESGDRSADESVLVTRDGRRVPIEVASTLIVVDGRPVGVLGLIHDLTERKNARNAQNALEQSETRFRALLESAPDCVVIADSNGEIVLANARTEELFGYRRDELLGRPVEMLLPKAVRAAHKKHRADYLADPGVRQMGAGLELAGRRKDGSEFPVDVSLSPLQTDEGVLVLASVRDVTDRKRAEEALLRSERQFRGSFESAPIGMALVAPDGRFLEVNESLCDLVGYSSAELVATTFQEITHADDLELDLEYVRQMLAGERRTYQMEKRYIHKGGDVVWILLSVSLVRSSDGKPLHFIAQIQDITERKRAHEALELSKAQLAEAQQIAHVGSWEHELASGSSSWSDEHYRIYGFEPGATELTRERIRECVHPDDRPFVDAAAATARETDQPLSVEYRIVLPDASVRWLHGRGEPVIENGVAVGLRGTVQDITVRKAAEQRLAEAEHRYRTLVEQLPLGTYIRPLDMSKPNIYASPQFEPMLGYTAADWEADPDLLARIVHPDDRDRVLGDAKRVRQTGEPVRDEYRYIARDGRTVWVQDETYLTCDEQGEPAFVQGFLLDITPRKLAEAERDRLRDQLHDAQKLEAIGRLAGGVAHDFNNMLTAIKGYSELLLDQLDSGGTLHGHAAQIQRAAEQASALPRQLLAFSRKQTLAPQVVDLNEIVSSASDLLKHLITEAVQLVTLPMAASPQAFVDSGQFEHVLVNLALNAREAMPGGGTLTIATENVEIGAEVAGERGVVPGSYVVVSVSDTGEGMDAETKGRAFEPFFTTRTNGIGSGLGLASVYGTVTQSGGFIELTTEPGRGATFEIHCPGVESVAVSAEALRDEQPKAERATVALVAEDEVIVRELAAKVLEQSGLVVHAAANGEQALELYQRLSDSIDVLVTDMVMPGMGGRELAERIREVNPNLPIVFISGYTEEAPPTEVDSGAGGAFLRKPFAARELVATVRDVLGDHSPSGNGGTPRVTCVVADDHPAVLDSVCAFLEARGFEVSRAARGDDALRLIETLRPTLALLDVAMEPLGGIEVARQSAVSSPDTRSVIYTGYSDEALLGRAMDAGARGFVHKEAPLSELERALTIVVGGGTYPDPGPSGATERATPCASPLTPREREILALVADGMTNDKVGAALAISPETVQSHVRNSMAKLDADTRTEAVATALRLSLIS